MIHQQLVDLFIKGMRTVDQDIVEKWNDGSITRPAKSEAIRKFNTAVGYKENSDMFNLFIKGKFTPTPDQTTILREIVEYYWNFYNPELATAL